MDNLELYCATCGHHLGEHVDDDDQVGACRCWLLCAAHVTVCTCDEFVPLAAVLGPLHAVHVRGLDLEGVLP